MVFLYPEHTQSDFIQQFLEADTFESHLDRMFPPTVPPAPWDAKGVYTASSVEIYFLANATKDLTDEMRERFAVKETKELQFHTRKEVNGKKRWLKVNKAATLKKALSHPEHIIPGLPVFHILVPGAFRKTFLTSQAELE